MDTLTQDKINSVAKELKRRHRAELQHRDGIIEQLQARNVQLRSELDALRRRLRDTGGSNG